MNMNIISLSPSRDFASVWLQMKVLSSQRDLPSHAPTKCYLIFPLGSKIILFHFFQSSLKVPLLLQLLNSFWSAEHNRNSVQCWIQCTEILLRPCATASNWKFPERTGEASAWKPPTGVDMGFDKIWKQSSLHSYVAMICCWHVP